MTKNVALQHNSNLHHSAGSQLLQKYYTDMQVKNTCEVRYVHLYINLKINISTIQNKTENNLKSDYMYVLPGIRRFSYLFTSNDTERFGVNAFGISEASLQQSVQ